MKKLEFLACLTLLFAGCATVSAAPVAPIHQATEARKPWPSPTHNTPRSNRATSPARFATKGTNSRLLHLQHESQTKPTAADIDPLAEGKTAARKGLAQENFCTRPFLAAVFFVF